MAGQQSQGSQDVGFTPRAPPPRGLHIEGSAQKSSVGSVLCRSQESSRSLRTKCPQSSIQFHPFLTCGTRMHVSFLCPICEAGSMLRPMPHTVGVKEFTPAKSLSQSVPGTLDD